MRRDRRPKDHQEVQEQVTVTVSKKGVAMEEGEKCPDCHEGTFQFVRKGECSCHIAPPCGSCTSAILKCDECGLGEDEIEEIRE